MRARLLSSCVQVSGGSRLELNGRSITLLGKILLRSNILCSLCPPRRLSGFMLIDECLQGAKSKINTSCLHSGRDVPNEWRNEIEFARDGLVPFPRRQISKPKPLNFLHRKDSFRTSRRMMHTHTDFLACFSFEMEVFGYPGYNVKRNLLILDLHFDDTRRVYLSIEVVTRFFCNLKKRS